MRTLIIGSRRSLLARAQTNLVRQMLLDIWDDLTVEIELIDTQGDLNRRDPLPAIGGKGLFTAELEGALRSRRIDLAVHSLKDLPVDYLKIDGSFVCDMVDSKMDHAMVAAINQIGHIMGVKTIAEFVENEDIIKQLQHLGVDFVQGYGISRPKPLSDATLQDMLRLASFKNGLVSAS